MSTIPGNALFSTLVWSEKRDTYRYQVEMTVRYGIVEPDLCYENIKYPAMVSIKEITTKV